MINDRVAQVLEDYRGRRDGLIKALTTDYNEFYQDCDPNAHELCLYGYPNGTWKVKPSEELVPTELPEPALGINIDDRDSEGWLWMVADHSDSWLISVAYHLAAQYGFDKNDRSMLFQMINELPNLHEVVNQNQSRIMAPNITSPPSITSAPSISSVPNVTSELSMTSAPSITSSPSVTSALSMTSAPHNPIVEDRKEDKQEKVEDEEDATCGECHESSGGFWIF